MARKDAYPREFKEPAVALNRSGGRSMESIAKELGISATSLTNWNRQAAIDAGELPGIATDDRAEVVRLRRDIRRLELENEILEKAAAYLAKENVLPKGLTDRSRNCVSRIPPDSGSPYYVIRPGFRAYPVSCPAGAGKADSSSE